MAVQFSLSYNADGDPVLVENTVTGTRQVVSSSSVVSPYKSRFETPNDGSGNTPETPETPDTPEEGNDIYRYINEMENNADNNLNLSFVEKQNLQRYTPEAMEAKGQKKSRTQQVMETIALAMIPYGQAAKGVVKALGKILPQESEEIKAIKQFYADPEMSTLVESIPGMSNYNLVYGNPFDPSYGLADAADRRTATMAKTLKDKYKMTPIEIEQAMLGTYTGNVDSDIIQRIKKTTDLSRKEREQKSNFVPEKSQSSITNQESQETAAYDPPRDRDPPSAPQKATETASYSNQSAYEEASGTGNNNSGNTGSTKSSQGTTTSQHQAFRN